MKITFALIREAVLENKYVLITGGGAGFGKSLAYEFAREGYSIALVSLLKDELDAVQADIKQKYPALDVKTLPLNLSAPDAHVHIAEWVENEKITLKGLVNNVGIGYAGHYNVTDEKFFSTLVQLNISLTHHLTRALIGKLIENKPAFILNVASMAAYFPLPYKTLYSASKSFILTFSKALRQEMKEHGVSVSCVCPGPMITNQAVRDRIQRLGWRKKLVSIAEPEVIAKITVKQLLKNKPVIITTAQDKASLALKAIIPAPLLTPLLGKLSKNSF